MASTTYRNNIVVFVAPETQGSWDNDATQAENLVTEALNNGAEVIVKGSLYKVVNAYGKGFYLTGFNPLISAIKDAHLVISSDRGVNPVIPVVVEFVYDVPWTVDRIADKALAQLHDRIADEAGRWSELLTVNAPIAVSRYFGTDGKAHFESRVNSTYRHINSILESIVNDDEDEDNAFLAPAVTPQAQHPLY